MKYFGLKKSKNEPTEMIKFLNSSAKAFYQSQDKFLYHSYESFFKANFLSALIDLERTSKGTFNCDIYLKNGNINLLREMFPNAVKNIFVVEDKKSLLRMGRFLETVRNMNAHSRISERDLEIFKYKFDHIENLKRINMNIQYYDNGLTIAGLIYIVLNFLRPHSIETLIKKDFIFAYITCGQYKNDNGEKFVSYVSHVNLECFIRQERGDTISSSIMGELVNNNITNHGFDISIGSERYPLYRVRGETDNNKIIIKKGSLTKAYYENDYILDVLDEESFMSLSNELPPFALVDYLYKKGISFFTKDIANGINREYVKKLNCPKFYIDKNINILQLPSTISDYRILSSTVVDSLNLILLSLENFIYECLNIDNDGRLSSLGIALKGLSVSEEVVRNIKYIRNFAAHGYTLGDYLIYCDEVVQFTLEYVVDSIYKLLNELKCQAKIYDYLVDLISKHFLGTIISMKYKKAIVFGRECIGDYPNINKKEMNIKCGFINNSCFDTCIFDRLQNHISHFDKKIAVIHIKDDVLYINDNDSDKELLSKFLKKNHYHINKQEDGFFVSNYYID